MYRQQYRAPYSNFTSWK